jgi:hypothetical protein
MLRSIPFFITLLCFITTMSASAANPPSAEHGRELFGSTSLGTNGRSCSTCHPGGTGLEDSAASDENSLKRTVNKCITNALKGKPLESDSLEMSSMLIYLKSLGAEKSK